MRIFRYVAISLWLVSLSALRASTTAPSGNPAEPSTLPSRTEGSDMKTAPDPSLSPQQVVEIQVHAMEHNDDGGPDSGIAVVFRFASPANRQQTGPLEKFIRMVKGPEYSPLINHQLAEYGQLHSQNEHAQQLVRITGADGQVVLYLFLLGKQSDGEFKDCWMTEGVVRLRPEEMKPAPPPGDNGDGGDGHDRA